MSNYTSAYLQLYECFLYSTKPLPDKNFCLNDCRCGSKFDLVLFFSRLILCLCLLECNLVFLMFLAFIMLKNYISLIDNRKIFH